MSVEGRSKPDLVRRHPNLLFFLLAWFLGAGIVTLGLWRALPAEFILTSVLSSSLAGILMTAKLDGREGLKLMFHRLVIWRVGIGYWIFALFFILLAVISGSLFNPLFQGDRFSLQHLEPAFNIPLMFFSLFIISGIGQELGWTGFLIPRLQARVSALAACIIRAILGSIWHLPIFFYSMLQPQALTDFQYAGWIAQKGFLTALLTATFIFMLPWSIIISWIFNNTKGSLLLVSVLHGSEIWVAYWMMTAGINPANLDNYWGYGAVMVLVAVAIIALNGWQDLSRHYKRITYPLSLGSRM